MRIAFIQPNSKCAKLTPTLANYSEPGMAYLAAIAHRLGHQVIQYQQIQQTQNEIISLIADFKPDVIGFSCFTYTVPSTIEFARKLRHAHGNKIKIIVGGSGANAEYETLLNSTYFDCVVLGEGEHTFMDLLDVFKHHKDISTVSGIGFKEKNAIILTEKRDRIIDINDLPHLYREGLPIASEYYRRYAPIEIAPTDQRKCSVYTSRGCPYNCSFCTNEKEWGTLWIGRDPDDVAEEILEVNDRYEINIVGIEDEDSLVRLANVFKAMNKVNSFGGRHIRYYLEGRIEDLKGNEDFKTLYESGCVEIEFGIESSSFDIRKKYNKTIETDKIMWAIEQAKKNKIATHAMFIIGDIHESQKTLKDLYYFCKKIEADRYRFAFMTPFNGTKIRADLPEAYVVQSDLSQWTSDYPVMVTDHLNLKELSVCRRNLMNRIYHSQWYLRSAEKRIKHVPALSKSYEEFIDFIDRKNN